MSKREAAGSPVKAKKTKVADVETKVRRLSVSCAVATAAHGLAIYPPRRQLRLFSLPRCGRKIMPLYV